MTFVQTNLTYISKIRNTKSLSTLQIILCDVKSFEVLKFRIRSVSLVHSVHGSELASSSPIQSTTQNPPIIGLEQRFERITSWESSIPEI